MSRVFRLVGWLVLLLALLCIVALVLLRFRPDSLVWAVNTSLSDTEITTDGLQLRYFPPSLTLQQANVVLPDQTIDLNVLNAEFDVSAWRRDTAYWSVTADKVVIDVTSTPPSPGAVTAESTNVALPNLAPFLSFTRLGIKQLEMTGDTPLSASLSADRSGDETTLDLKLDQGGQRYTLDGAVTSVAGEPLSFLFKLAGWSLSGEQQAADTRSLSATLGGTLAHEDGTTLSINSGDATLGAKENAVLLAAITGMVNIPAAGDKIVFERLGAAITSAEAGVDNMPATLSGSAVFGADALDLVANGAIDKSRLNVALAFANATGAMSGKIDINSDGLPDGIEHAPFAKADLFPATLSTSISTENERLKLTDLTLDTPKNALQGSLSLSTGEPIELVADLYAPRLYYPLVSETQDSNAQVEELSIEKTDVAGTASTEKTEDSAKADPANARLFSDAPIDWSWLSTAIIDAKLVADTLALQDAQFQDLTIRLLNEQDSLRLEPFAASLGDGGFEGSLSLDLIVGEDSLTPSTPVELTLNFEMNGVELEAFGLVPKEELSGGLVEATVSLTTGGNTSAQLASGLNGDILMMVEQATLMNDFVEVVGSDIVMETLNKLNPFAKEDPTTELSCALVRFTAEDGKLTTKNQLVMETSKMEIVGSGNINLNDEKLSIGITPNAKSGVGINVGSAVKFLKLGGTLSAPRPAVSAGGLLKSGLAIGAAISTGGASVVAEGLAKRALGAGSACDAVRKDSKKTEQKDGEGTEVLDEKPS